MRRARQGAAEIPDSRSGRAVRGSRPAAKCAHGCPNEKRIRSRRTSGSARTRPQADRMASVMPARLALEALRATADFECPSDKERFTRQFTRAILFSMKAKSRLPSDPDYDELVGLVRDLPRGRIGQIVNGKLHVSASCDAAHAHTLAELSATLIAGSPLGDPVPAGWTFLAEVELVFPGETLVLADIAGWQIPHDRLAALPNPISVVPQWICEVLDPSTRVLDLTHKRHHYALSGVSYLWIVDPVARVLEVYENS